MRNGLLVKYGEIAIRGKNRYIFEDKLIEAIENNVRLWKKNMERVKSMNVAFYFNSLKNNIYI